MLAHLRTEAYPRVSGARYPPRPIHEAPETLTYAGNNALIDQAKQDADERTALMTSAIDNAAR